MYLSRHSGFLRLSAVRQMLSLLALFSLILVVAWGGTYLLIQREMLRSVDARLIQRMDAYQGATIFTTSPRESFDSELLRRIRYVLDFASTHCVVLGGKSIEQYQQACRALAMPALDPETSSAITALRTKLTKRGLLSRALRAARALLD